MRINKNKTNCCGCTACESICSHNAIRMTPDSLGFLYPEIDNDLCVDCGLCEQVCPFYEDYDKTQNLSAPMAYAIRHKDMHEVETSQSGAAFIAFSDWVLNQGGAVYGVGYAEHFRVIHKRAVTKEERNEFKGSKYVQSDVNTTFKQVKKDLKNGLVVLFSGTPCQTAGLSSYVGEKLCKNLYLIDIICHGVPAPLVWNDYLKYLEKKEKMSLVDVNFRDKSYGWTSHVETFRFKDSQAYKTYSYTFYTSILLRYSCSSCPFTNLQRPSDITIGDFWGIQKTNAAFLAEDNKGCSLVLVNTKKGKEWLDRIKGFLIYIPIELSICIQPNLQNPTILHPKRTDFEKDYAKYGFDYTMKKYGYIGWKCHIKCFIKRFVPYSIKSKFKQLIKFN